MALAVAGAAPFDRLRLCDKAAYRLRHACHAVEQRRRECRTRYANAVKIEPLVAGVDDYRAS